MKKIGLLILAAVTIVLVASCRKDSNSIDGTIRFTHPSTGIPYFASLATISLFKGNGYDEGALANYSTKIDQYGYFNFPRVNKGDYKVHIYYTYDTYIYDTLVNVSFKLNDKKTLDLTLVP